MEKTNLHIVGGSSRARAEQARTCFALGHHAEVYAELDELLERAPGGGVILLADDSRPHGVAETIARLGDAGIWQPVIVTAEEIVLERVVRAIRAGALDYVALPLEMSRFARRLEQLLAEVHTYEKRRRSEVEARRRILRLSGREREVLALLSAGQTNKEIALGLKISPRTVEIHRANMMGKMGASHAADAVKAWIASGLEPLPGTEAKGSDDNIEVLSLPEDRALPVVRRQRQ